MPTASLVTLLPFHTCRGSGSELPWICACTSGLHACMSLSRSGSAGASTAADAADCT